MGLALASRRLHLGRIESEDQAEALPEGLEDHIAPILMATPALCKRERTRGSLDGVQGNTDLESNEPERKT